MSPTGRAGGLTLTAMTLAVILGLAGCIGDVTLPEEILWEATLAATGAQPTASGRAAAISRARSTETGIHVEGFGPGAYSWQIRAGTCADPGEIVGPADRYPDLTVSIEGEASADRVVVPVRMQPDRRYHVIVHVGPDSGVLACGNFAERV
jgi:hypothetical protein